MAKETNETRDLDIVTDEIMTAKHNNVKLAEARKAVDAYYANPSDENQDLVSENTKAIHDLLKMVKDYSDALAELKTRIEFCVVNLFDYAPALAEHFKIQGGAKTIKCDATPTSMALLMEAFEKKGYAPEGLFSMCTPITAKKAAEAFGLSEQALLEELGDLFATHYNKPSVKMLY